MSDLTHDWDAVVSFRVAELNASIARHWTPSKVSIDKLFSIQEDALGLTIEFQLHIGSPSLSFFVLNGTAFAVLELPFSGSYAIKRDAIQNDDATGVQDSSQDARQIYGLPADTYVMRFIVHQDNVSGVFFQDPADPGYTQLMSYEVCSVTYLVYGCFTDPRACLRFIRIIGTLQSPSQRKRGVLSA